MSAGFGASGSGGQGFAIRLEADGDTKLGNSTGDLHQVTGTLQLNENVFVLANGRVGINTDEPAYKLGVAGNVGLNEYIYHNGDADTFIRLQDDSINIQAGGADFITLTENDTQDEVVINENSTDIDFRVESNNAANMLHVDGANNRVGIGTATPLATLDIQERTGIESVLRLRGSADVGIRLAADSDNSGENDNPYIDFYQDGQNSNSRNNRLANIAMEGDAGTSFTDSIANAFFLNAHCPNAAGARPFQIATDQTDGTNKARITVEGTNGYVGLHTAVPTHPLEVSGNAKVAGTTTSQFYVTQVKEQDLGTGTSSTLTVASGTILLDADSINGVEQFGMEIHSLAFPRGSDSGTRLSLIVKTTTNSVFILPSGLVSGTFDSLNNDAGVTATEYVWISEGAHQAWHQVK
jgi:hypothetical protein